MRNTTKANVSGWLAMALPALLPMTAFGEPLMLDAQPAVVSTGTQLAEAPAPAPTIIPAPVPSSVPVATAPVPPANPALPDGKILILPFQADNPNDATPWLGKSIQESMMADLTVAAPDRVKVSDQTAASPDAAIVLGKQSGARYVIAGGFATINQELRITGKVLDVETGKSVAGLKVTGDPGQLFHMEDALALQVRAQVLGQQVGPMQPPPADQQPQVAQAQPAPVVGQDISPYAQPAQQPYTSPYAIAPAPVVYGADVTPDYYPSYVSGFDPYYYPTGYAYSPYYCDYGYYGGCYPFGLGFGFYFGNDFGSRFHRGFDRDHGRDGRG
ncbi:MAG TPA: hypothetical protein VFE47_21075, partial [Tepidisphaeraceae bacterium]|nr:hypothetical protein [Tepidisphaeraceae bacterium]